MALTFRYKNLASLSYAPGTAKAGENGDMGKQGTSGNTLYFIDYDLDNSYAIQLALQRIENNQILSSTRDKTINDRPYKENDIILSSSGKTYRIINSKESSAKNYKFDIEVLGAIHNQPSVNISKIIIANITSYDDITSVNDIDNSKYAYVQKSAATTNSANSLIGNEYTPKDFIMAGTWIKVYVVVTLSTISNPDLTETEQLESQYIDLLKMQDKTNGNSYSLTLYLNNKKSFQGMTPPCDYETDPVPTGLNGIFSFYKKLEFPNLSIFKGSTFNDCLGDEINAKELDDNGNLIYHFNVKPLSNIYFLSDIEMDGMHPSGNEIRCTLSASSDPIWYKTGKGTDYPSGELSLGRGAFVFPYTDNIDEITSFSSEGYTKCELTNMKYHYNMVFNSTSNHNITSNDFPNYAVGESLAGLSSIKDEAFDDIDVDSINNNLLQFSKRRITFYEDPDSSVTNNIRGGDSAYFSSIRKSKNDNDIFENGKTISKEIFKFLKNASQNRYVISVKNNETKEVSFYDIPVEFIDYSNFKNLI